MIRYGRRRSRPADSERPRVSGRNPMATGQKEPTMTNKQMEEITDPDPFLVYAENNEDGDDPAMWEQHGKEHERRRKIGEKLDPKTALTAYWYCIDIDPYDMLTSACLEEACGSSVRRMFARDPEARDDSHWVMRDDLSGEMQAALDKRNNRLFKNGAIEIVMDAVWRFREETKTVPEQGTGFWIGPTDDGGCAVYWRMKDETIASFVVTKQWLKGDPREARRWTRVYIDAHLEDLKEHLNRSR